MSLSTRFETIFGDALSEAGAPNFGSTPKTIGIYAPNGHAVQVPFPYLGEAQRLERFAEEANQEYEAEGKEPIYLAKYHLWRSDVFRLRNLIDSTFSDTVAGRNLTNLALKNVSLPAIDIEDKGFDVKVNENTGEYVYGAYTEDGFSPVLRVDMLGSMFAQDASLQKDIEALIAAYSIRSNFGLGDSPLEEIGHPSTRNFDFCLKEATKLAYDVDVIETSSHILSDSDVIRDFIMKTALWKSAAESYAEDLIPEKLPPSMRTYEIEALQEGARDILNSWDQLLEARFVSNDAALTMFDSGHPRIGAIPLYDLVHSEPQTESEANMVAFCKYLISTGSMSEEAIFANKKYDTFYYGDTELDINSVSARQAYFICDDDVRDKLYENEKRGRAEAEAKKASFLLEATVPKKGIDLGLGML